MAIRKAFVAKRSFGFIPDSEMLTTKTKARFFFGLAMLFVE